MCFPSDLRLTKFPVYHDNLYCWCSYNDMVSILTWGIILQDLNISKVSPMLIMRCMSLYSPLLMKNCWPMKLGLSYTMKQPLSTLQEWHLLR